MGEAARQERAAFDEARHRLDRLLDAWVSGQRDEELRPVLNEVRDAYEQARRRLEQAILLSGQGLGEVDQETATALAEVCETCRGAEAEKEEAEKEYAKLLRTYEGKKREVEDEFARQRAKYERAMAEVREEMEKAPDRFRQLYEPILAKYREECNREREKVVAAGGLHILGTERHESRRIDNQLRGRSGRQGDPGSSRFYLSLEDDLLRIFGSQRIQRIMDRLGMEEGEPIEHKLVTRAIATAQKRVENHSFEIRKHLLEYDDVMNQQRQVIYQQRKEIMRGETLREMVSDMVDELLEGIVDIYADEKLPPAEWDWKGLEEALFRQFCLRVPLGDEERESLTAEGLQERLREPVWRAYEAKEVRFGPERLRLVERWVILRHVDSLWKDHLLNMDHLREGIGLRGYGQRDPLQEYKREAFDMFMEMAHQIKSGAVGELFRVELAQEAEAPVEVQRRPQRVFLGRGQTPQASEGPKTVRRDGKKVGRNDPCICGSGKKYKKCCGAAA
ncbi:MAG: SEC-C domain-containing protein [Deltaproteobacteria bacterium]|nr:SEC-C domain-containing protein [Deltaproteobacteria bacterium]